MARQTKYKTKFAEVAYKLCKEKGYTDKQLAVHFKVSEATINNWKRRFLEFLESLKKGKDDFDSRVVEQSLLKRAVGYIYVETTREPCVLIKRKGKKLEISKVDFSNVRSEMVVTKTVTKDVAPDVTAQIFWLKNRQPERWRDTRDLNVGGSLRLILEDE